MGMIGFFSSQGVAETTKMHCFSPSSEMFSESYVPNSFLITTDSVKDSDAFQSIQDEEIELEFVDCSVPLNKELENLHSIPKNEFIGSLKKILKDYAHSPLEKQLVLINKLSSPVLFPLIINSFLTDPQALDQIVKKSYHHHNGFEKIVLLADDDFSLRLHVWWKGSDEGSLEDVHNHRWDFVSSIILGVMSQDFFDIIDETDIKPEIVPKGCVLTNHYRYTPYKKDLAKRDISAKSNFSRYGLEPLGFSIIKLENQVKIPRGFSYLLRRDLLHRVISDYKETVATLMFSAKPYGESSEVYCVHDRSILDEHHQLVTVKPICKRKVKKTLKDVIDLYTESKGK